MPPKKKNRPDPSVEDGLVEGVSPDGREKFTLFYGRGPVFSNFHPSKFALNGAEFVCGEQFFHYMKAVHFGDDKVKEEILAAKDPRAQKALGRRVANYEEKEWAEAGPKYMKEGIRAKFEQNPDLLEQLLKTRGRTLVEASPRDRKWGIGLGIHNERALDRKCWRGTNLLGRILTEVREELLAASAPSASAGASSQDSGSPTADAEPTSASDDKKPPADSL